MSNRAYSLDALRGYAIITMVLSGAIVTWVMPDWMCHTQVPPPDFVYNSALTGLTWVDLVFPFFLFAMGAAFPFSIGKRIEQGETKFKLSYDAIVRGFRLTFFAIFIQHFYPYVLSAPQDLRSWILALVCFFLLFPMFMRIPIQIPKWAQISIKWGAYALAIIMMLTISYAGGRTFSLSYSNIIILLLANMATFATILYIFTQHNLWARFGVLALVMAILLGSEINGSWTKTVYDFTPIPWMYHFDYLKYLFIVIPGSIAGESIMKWMKTRKQNDDQQDTERHPKIAISLLILTTTLVIVNLYGLYTHALLFNLLATVVLLIIGLAIVTKQKNGIFLLWKKLFEAGAFFLLLGLCFEPFQGGIKKDPATFSYFFVTSGLAFMALLFFNIICDYFKCLRSTRFLVMSGQNPMIAYVACDLLIYPILHLTGLYPLLHYLYANAWLGLIHGIILTTIVVLVTVFCTKKKWYWKT